MKILTDKYSVALNQVAVQALMGGVLAAIALISFICFMIAFTQWLNNTGDPLVEFLITALLGVLASGRINCSERYAETLKELIKEKS